MAKKQSAYTRLRNNYLARVRRLKKKGIKLDEPIPETEKQLRKKGITGQKLSAETRKMKKSLDTFESKKAYNEETGEVGTVEQLRKSQKDAIPPEDLAFRVFQDFVQKISQPVPDPSTTKNYGYRKALEETRRQQITLIMLIDNMVEEVGEVEIGRRLIKSGGEYIELLIKGLYASDSTVVLTSGTELAGIIKGTPLTLEEAFDLSEDLNVDEVDYEERFIR